jgi:hypothetical protein
VKQAHSKPLMVVLVIKLNGKIKCPIMLRRNKYSGEKIAEEEIVALVRLELFLSKYQASL